MAKSKRPRPSFDPASPADGDTPWVRRSSPATDKDATEEPGAAVEPEAVVPVGGVAEPVALLTAAAVLEPAAAETAVFDRAAIKALVKPAAADTVVVQAAGAAAPSTAVAVRTAPAAVAPPRRRRITRPRPGTDVVATVGHAIAAPFTLAVTLLLAPLSLLRGRTDRQRV